MGAFKTRVEQFRQALSIHGGVLGLCAATLAVKLSRVPIPSKRLRLRLYRRIYGTKYTTLDEAELEQPLGEYRSFNALFTRGVRPEFRPISQSGDHLLCPCDGRVQDLGILQKDKILTVKGIEYTLASLLAGAKPEPFHGGHFAILFLSPADCHRIFSPQDGCVEEVLHVPGSRLLVHPPYQRKEFPVFCLNERVIVRMRTPLGACALVLVAGWGVGNITLPLDRKFRPRHRSLKRKAYDPPLNVRRGDWLATFELGSTAILITEPSERWTPCVGRDDKVKYGQPLFGVRADAPGATDHGRRPGA
jgi:phosphatidylserine decarboxylase